MLAAAILDAALTLLMETRASAQSYVACAPALLQILLPETYGINNDLRIQKGLAPLTQCPDIVSLEDEVPYETELCRTALPYALAANLLLADEEEARAQNFFVKYADAVNAAMRIRPVPVRDVYTVSDRNRHEEG